MSSPTIADDPEIFAKPLETLKASFLADKTKPISFRVAQLKSFKAGCIKFQQQLCEAVEKDLSRTVFLTTTFEFGLMIADIDD
jgi:aldehyde dehydrogenase (NAD+)